MKPIQLDDKLFQAAVSLERTDRGVKPWRIPYREYDLFPPEGISGKAEVPAGVRLRFESNTIELQLQVTPSEHERLFDCVIDGKLWNTFVLPVRGQTVLFRDLPSVKKTIELYLSQIHPVEVVGLSINEGASFKIPADERPRWITYGSSITQCGTAASPAQTWPALVAREQRLNLTSLGYGGNCHLEPMVARMISDLPADFISLCLGINIYGQSSFSLRTFKAAIIGFIQILREKHRDIPLAIMSPIYSPSREETVNKVDLTLMQIREEIETAVHTLRKLGDTNLHYIHGLDIFGPEYAAYLPDQLHPDAEGYRVLARRFQQWVTGKIDIRNHAV